MFYYLSTLNVIFYKRNKNLPNLIFTNIIYINNLIFFFKFKPRPYTTSTSLMVFI